MPIGNESYLENTLELLKGFIVDSKRVEKGRTIIGYGIRKEDFKKRENDSNATTKMFSGRIDKFLELGYVKRLKHKSNKDKYFSITPLGITYFCSNLKEIDFMVLSHVMSHLKFFYEQGMPDYETSYIQNIQDSWQQLQQIFNDESKLHSIFLSVFKDIEQEKFDDTLEINLNYETYLGLKTPVIIYQIVDSEYRLIMDHSIDDVWTSNYYVSTEKEFNYNFAKFVLKAFSFAVLENISHTIMSSDAGNKNTHISTFNKIPLEIHGMALEFSDELSKSQNKISVSVSQTNTNIRNLMESRGIKTIHELREEKETKRFRKQWDTYLELLERIDRDKIAVKSKTELKELMIKNMVCKDKEELDTFWNENGKDIRKSFYEEVGIKGMYERIFVKEIKEIKRINKELKREYEEFLKS